MIRCTCIECGNSDLHRDDSVADLFARVRQYDGPYCTECGKRIKPEMVVLLEDPSNPEIPTSQGAPD